MILGYLEDGADLVTLAMNGWGEGEPGWWLNLQAQPRARVQLKNGRRDVTAYAATGQERGRLWDRWSTLDRRLTETAVVVLTPRR